MSEEQKFIPYEYEVTATIKLRILCDEDEQIEKAVQEMSENLSTSDLITQHGCIVKGQVNEFKIVKK